MWASCNRNCNRTALQQLYSHLLDGIAAADMSVVLYSHVDTLMYLTRCMCRLRT
jgi:hypothetical protein